MKTKKINRGGFAVVADPAFAEGSTARLVTGHSLQWLKAQPSKSISIFFFSPPYNKRLRRKRGSREGGTWSGAALLVDGYASYSDDMPHDLYVQWMHDLLTECWRVLKDDGAIFFQHKDQQYRGVTITPDELNPGLPLRQRIIWDRGSGPCSNYNFLRPSYEFIYLFAKPKFKFGTSGKIMDVLRIAPAKSSHPAPFPVELPHRIFQQLKPEHDVICDVFSGSGSTGVAARATGRHYVGIDIDAGYNEEAAERLNCTVETLAAPEPRKRLSVKATLFNDDCLKSMAKLPDESVHLIAIDLPYGVSAEAWDKIVPMAKMFAEFRRILTPTGNIVMTAQGRFTAALIAAAPDLYCYSMVWAKTRKTQHLHKDYRALAEHEDVLVFAKGGMGNNAAIHPTYNPQGLVELDKPITSRNGNQKDSFYKVSGLAAERGRFQTHTNYPSSILYFPSVGGKEKVKGKGNAPQTQKPVALMDYLIRTYSNSGDTVLDCTMGSGTTGVAALQAERNFIGMEISPRFFENTVTRLQASAPNAMFVVSGPEPVQPDLVDQIIAKKRAAYWASRKSADVVTLVAACRTKPPTPDIIIDDLCDYLIAA
ncbi:DNA-methyltransferase [Brevundimonas sp.]|uniref:DNA-methyltransferase n=1 Tax=Brevundimonas sp. TaxID=1871086 RepID=UPI003D0B90DD